jgi:transposase
MFSLNDSMRYFLCPGATDMRKSFYTLSGLVVNVMKQEVCSGDVFIFINRRRTTIKLLHAEYGGLVLYIKKLEEGTFALPLYDETTHSYPMEWRDLVLMVEGIRDNPGTRLKRLKMK